MPEQAEFVSDSGDYTWRPEYVRRAVESLRRSPEQYDTATIGDKLAAQQDEITQLDARINHLEGLVHRYLNRAEGTL